MPKIIDKQLKRFTGLDNEMLQAEPQDIPVRGESLPPVDEPSAPRTRLVGVNERGNRVGEDHPCAVLTDHDVELLLELRAEGWGYRRLAAKFDCSKTLARKICKGKVRAQYPTRFKPV